MNINTALGMVERPLQVADCPICNGIGSFAGYNTLPNGECSRVVCLCRRVDPLRDEVAELREQLAASKDTLASMQYSEAQHDLACEELGINLFPHEDGDTLIEAVCALKQQLADVTRERDVARREVNELAELLLQAKNQLATVQRVLVDSLNLTEVGDEFAPPCVDVDNAMSLAAATEVAIDTLKLSAEKHKLDAEEANKALATVQAVAAAMRAAVELRLRSVSKILDEGRVRQPNNQVVQDSVWHGWLRERQVLCELLNEEFPKAAGRELIDELKELKLEAYTATQSYHAMRDRIMPQLVRMTNKAHNAKLAYAETLQGKIDPAWFGEQSPVWQYRGHVHGAVWRTCDGKMIEYGGNRLGWDRSTAYRDWEECCADMRTYPCDEHGKRIEEVKMPSMQELDELCTEPCKEWRDDRSFADEDYDKRIADLERQLADHKRDAELFRELRAWIKNGVFSVVGYSVVIGCQCVPTELAELLVSIRDGGAK